VTPPYPPLATSTPFVIISSQSVIFRSFAELAAYSELVVIGKVIKEDGLIIHGARNPLDTSVPAEGVFSIARIYQVQVDRYIKGDGPEMIYLSQGEGLLLRETIRGETPTAEEIEQITSQNKGREYIPPEFDHPYLMFLARFDKGDYKVDGYTANEIFGAAVHPWLFDLKDPDRIQAQDAAAWNMTDFPPKPLSTAIEEINQPYQRPTPDTTNPVPYPAP